MLFSYLIACTGHTLDDIQHAEFELEGCFTNMFPRHQLASYTQNCDVETQFAVVTDASVSVLEQKQGTTADSDFSSHWNVYVHQLRPVALFLMKHSLTCTNIGSYAAGPGSEG